MAEEIKNVQTESAKAPSSTSSSGSSKTATTIVIVVVVIIALLGIGGWAISKFFAQKIGEKTAESLIGAATGGNVDVDTKNNSVNVKSGDGSLSVGSNSVWPKEIPSTVPKFTYGDVNSSVATTSPQSWVITFENAESDAYANYQKDLQRAGYITKTQTDVDNVKSSEMEGTEWTVLFSVDGSDKSASVSVYTKQ